MPSGAGVVCRLAESIGLASSLSAVDGGERNVLIVGVQHGLAGFQINLRLTPAACIGAVIKAIQLALALVFCSGFSPLVGQGLQLRTELQAPLVHQLDLFSPGLTRPVIPLLLKPEAVIGSLRGGDRLRAEQPRQEEQPGIASSGDRTNGHQGVAEAGCGAT